MSLKLVTTSALFGSFFGLGLGSASAVSHDPRFIKRLDVFDDLASLDGSIHATSYCTSIIDLVPASLFVSHFLLD